MPTSQDAQEIAIYLLLCQINDGAEHGLKAVKALLAAHPEANEGEKP